ncbi:hypothetical protein F4861DRAFT_534976 [Xylaria intraflava]|nr:hypothetical protein F4861DRAFT_534976 [Xylaria intraflava]
MSELPDIKAGALGTSTISYCMLFMLYLLMSCHDAETSMILTTTIAFHRANRRSRHIHILPGTHNVPHIWYTMAALEAPGSSTAPTTFENLQFPYGGPLSLSIEANERLVRITRDVAVVIERYRFPRHATAQGPSKRKLMRSNRLGIDETEFASPTSVGGYWAAVLAKVPPQPWVNRQRLFYFLARCRPLEKPYKTQLWRMARKWLDATIKAGSSNGWKRNTLFAGLPQDDSFWDAIRIIGDSHAGFGTFPSALTIKMQQAGVAWLLVCPERRIIPQCWKYELDIFQIPYARSMPNAATTDRPHRRAPPSDDRHLQQERVSQSGRAQISQRVEPIRVASTRDPVGYVAMPYDEQLLLRANAARAIESEANGGGE